MKNDLSRVWMDNELKSQKRALEHLTEAHNFLKDTTTDYANGIVKMARLRENIISLIETTTDK